MKLCGRPTSGHSRRAPLFLSIPGLDFDRILVDKDAGEDRTLEHLAFNSLDRVPTLVDGENVVTNSTAILVYLARKYGDHSWLPTDLEDAAAVQRWLFAASGELYRGPVQCRAARRMGRKVEMTIATDPATHLSTGWRDPSPSAPALPPSTR